MKSFAVVSVLASVVFAQTTSSLIPAGISQGCSSYLTSLNNDASLSSCTGPIISATSQILAGNSSVTNSAVSSTLNTICGSSVQCDETSIRTKLADFYQNCNAELTTNRNEDVADLYDALYTIAPLNKAICSKDDSGAYCATQIPSQTAVSSLFTTAGSAAQSVFKLNTDTFKSSNLAFLFLKATTDESKLCSSCTRSILTSYVSFESNSPYASGLGQSPILGGQSDLYNAVTSKCGSTFLQGAVQAAGSLSDGIISSDAMPRTNVQAGGLAALLGAASIVAAFAF